MSFGIMFIYLWKYQCTVLGKHATAVHKSNLNRLEKNTGLHSLYSRGDEGHTDHDQVQDIEIVPTERTFMEECSIGSHLSRSKVMYETAKWQNRARFWKSFLCCFAILYSINTTFRMISMVKRPVKTWSA